MSKPRHWEDPATALAGLWLVASPWVLDYQGDTTAMVNASASGTALIILGVAASIFFRHWMALFAAAIALWLLISPWTLGFVNVKLAAWNEEVAGAMVFLLSVWTLLSRDTGEDEWEPAETP